MLDAVTTAFAAMAVLVASSEVLLLISLTITSRDYFAAVVFKLVFACDFCVFRAYFAVLMRLSAGNFAGFSIRLLLADTLMGLVFEACDLSTVGRVFDPSHFEVFDGDAVVNLLTILISESGSILSSMSIDSFLVLGVFEGDNMKLKSLPVGVFGAVLSTSKNLGSCIICMSAKMLIPRLIPLFPGSQNGPRSGPSSN